MSASPMLHVLQDLGLGFVHVQTTICLENKRGRANTGEEQYVDRRSAPHQEKKNIWPVGSVSSSILADPAHKKSVTSREEE